MPVTTEPANALGREIWGYPKEVADVSIEHSAERTQTTVDVDGERLLSMDVARPPSVSLGMSGYSYTEFDGELVRAKTEIAGDIGIWPFSEQVSIEFGDHPRTEKLDALDFGPRALQRVSADCKFTIYPRQMGSH